MVPTDPPGLEDRNVRWCHCACREPHPSPVQCCSAWGSCSRGRRRWPEWRWQERLLERGDKCLWQLLLNKHLPCLGSDGYGFNESMLTSSHAGVSTSPCPLARRQEHNPRREENTICSGAPKPFSQAEPFLSCSVPLQGLLGETLCCTASLQWHNVFTQPHAFPPSISKPSALLLVEMLDLALMFFLFKIASKGLWEEFYNRKALPIRCHYHLLDLSLPWFCCVWTQEGCWLSSARCWNASVELVRLMRLTFTVEIHCSFNQFTRDRKQMARKKMLSTIQLTRGN